jgi:hypothetical protein
MTNAKLRQIAPSRDSYPLASRQFGATPTSTVSGTLSWTARSIPARTSAETSSACSDGFFF